MAAPAASEDMDVEVEAFLASCAASAYGAAAALLDRLDAPRLPRSRADPAAGQDCLRTFNFRIIPDDPHLQQQGFRQITTVEMPGIFVPRSVAFYEGLGQQPDSIFRGKTVAQLGCGNGWMSIALAQRWSPFKVYGLDINPRAIKIARINLYLNALDDDGLPIYDREGKTLLDRIEFHESDLLSCCRDSKIELDCIIGCIPQVLDPNPEVMPKIKINNSSEEFLHSLCNYCAFQGVVEDQFGLGLIARAVEEGIALIKPMGIMRPTGSSYM